MKVLVSGASGFLGKKLVQMLARSGHDVRPLVRGESAKPNEVSWNVESGEIEHEKVAGSGGCDAVIHLAGENIAAHRWTDAQKERIRRSRVEATRQLANAIARTMQLPTFISASAIGYYGNRGDEVLTEESPKGEGFLPNVSEEWEFAASPLQATGTRIVHPRFGMILDSDSGALGKMLPIFRSGMGGRLGSGKQWMSWISREDAVRAIEFALNSSRVAGPLNVVSPHPVTNREFTKTLGDVMHRPTILPAPAYALRLALGEMADGLLLSSQRVLPTRLLEAGFEFKHPTLASALAACL